LTARLPAQEPPGKQLQFIIEDARQFFERTKGSEALDLDSTPIYKSKMTLSGTKDNTIQIAKDGKTWAFYHAYVSDSLSLRDAKKLAGYWRSLIENNAAGFVEDKTKKLTKTVMGKTLHGYSFIRKEGTTEYSIFITYSKGLTGTYLLFLQIGRQY
jgi:hypothetical protein